MDTWLPKTFTTVHFSDWFSIPISIIITVIWFLLFQMLRLVLGLYENSIDYLLYLELILNFFEILPMLFLKIQTEIVITDSVERYNSLNISGLGYALFNS